MSNHAMLIGTKFVDSDGIESYGFRISDNYAKSYDNWSECPIEGDLELLAYAVENGDEQAQSILNFVAEEEKGIDINDTWYDWEEIKAIMNSTSIFLCSRKRKSNETDLC